jgi:UDP-N-acetylmuramoyl-tripeptide--D-alanyl-D-alanine ligase
MTVAEVARLVDGQVEGAADTLLTGAEVDSRCIGTGDLFIALPGARRDGHEFVGSVLDRGGAALVRHQAELASPPPGGSLIRVQDPLSAYHTLARHEGRRRSWQVAAITGSVGKTTTKEFLAHILAPYRRTGATAGNRNSTLGLPAQMLSQPEEVEVFVAEAGMNRPGELDLLGGILRPYLLLYTRLAPAHTEFFPDMEDIVRAKAELLAHLDPSGYLVVNRDDPHQQGFTKATRAQVLSYGHDAPRARLAKVEDCGLLGSRFELVLGGERADVELALPGAHQRENLLAAAAAASALGITAAQVAQTVPGLQAAPHRGRVHRTGSGVTIVDDSYNASPVAMARLLDLLAVATGRRVAVLGEMYELGSIGQQAHGELGRQAAASCDLLVAVGGDLARTMTAAARTAGLDSSAAVHVEHADAATARLNNLLEEGDVVLVKGSRGVGLDRTVADLLSGEAG